jgi:glycosyltransferase involved in cell wall biosynthesis
MTRILLMETGSFKVIGGAAKETYALYKRLTRDSYHIDLLGAYKKIDSNAVTVDVGSAMERDYDIVWMNSIRDVPIADRYRRSHSKSKFIFVDRGNIISNFIGEGIKALHPKSVARRLLANSLRGWLDCYVAISIEQLPAARSFFSSRTAIKYIPIAPHEEYRVLRMHKAFSGGISVSRLDERQKRISFMIKGIVRLRHLYPEIGNKRVLKIVGTGVDDGRYKSLAQSLGVSKNISFEGFKTGDELIRQYNDAGFFVSTSIWESFGRSLLEAMACGLPALINNDINTVVSEKPKRSLVRNGLNGMIYDSCDIDDFAKKFHMLYSNERLRRKMSSNALSFISGFSFSKVVRDYEKLLDSMA